MSLSYTVLALSLLGYTSLAHSGQAFVTVRVYLALARNNFAGVCLMVAEVSNITVIIILTATGVTVQVTDRLGVGTVQVIVVATCRFKKNSFQSNDSNPWEFRA